jgi:hypothetical protein
MANQENKTIETVKFKDALGKVILRLSDIKDSDTQVYWCPLRQLWVSNKSLLNKKSLTIANDGIKMGIAYVKDSKPGIEIYKNLMKFQPVDFSQTDLFMFTKARHGTIK